MARASLLPLAILFVVIAVLVVVGFIVYSIVQEVTNTTREKMEKRNVMFTKDGMTVGVKELKEEDYVDRSQRLVPPPLQSDEEMKAKLTLDSILVNMWNHTSFPAYKSRLWNMAGKSEDQAVEKRRP